MKISRIDTTHLRNDALTELEVRNKAFENLVKEHFDETAARTDIVLREARGKLGEAYCVIAERVNALAVVEGTEAPFV